MIEPFLNELTTTKLEKQEVSEESKKERLIQQIIYEKMLEYERNPMESQVREENKQRGEEIKQERLVQRIIHEKMLENRKQLRDENDGSIENVASVYYHVDSSTEGIANENIQKNNAKERDIQNEM